MTTAKLSAALLASKGSAQPLANIYEHPMQKPINLAFEHSMERPRKDRGRHAPIAASERDAKMSLRLERDQHRKLKILAARRGESLQAVLREALNEHLNSYDQDCECMRNGGCGTANCRCHH